LEGLELCLGGLSPPKPPVATGCVDAKHFSLVRNFYRLHKNGATLEEASLYWGLVVERQ